ncbi:MAG TPA: alkaline phosphatase family protein [Novosphingobium sp.]|nr:alkaline phosphatase family protein [Novosphingobium sp.]
MRRFVAPLIVAAALALSGCATAPARTNAQLAPAPSGPPRLLVAVSVDQFSADLFAQYRQHYTAGLGRLLQGAVFPSGYQSHAATETCPGHSTLLTGAHPARTGIIANTWYDPGIARADKRIYCAEDESDPASTSRDPVVSAVHLKVPTLGDLMKAANPASRNVAVSAKDRAMIMMGGHNIDAAYWWKGSSFVTLGGRTLSPAAVAENTAVAALLKSGAPAMAAPAWCAPRDRAIAAGKLTIGTGRFVLDKDKPDLFRVSPRMDGATVDLANRLVDELDLGRGAAPDILSVSLSATDYVGHAVGTEGMEMCIQMAELDQALGRLLAHLDARGTDYAVMLSADHGGLDAPERLDEQALPRAVRVDKALSIAELAKAVSARTGITTSAPLLYGDGSFGDFTFNRTLTPAQKTQAVAALVAITRSHPQVAAVFTADEMAKAPVPSGSPQDWSLKDRARASFDPARSGDVVVLLDRAVVPIPEPAPGYTATHGSPWDYDRRVPMLFWRRGVAGLEQPAPVETVDIAPTLAALIGLKVADGAFDGRCLDIDGGAGNSCDRLK